MLSWANFYWRLGKQEEDAITLIKRLDWIATPREGGKKTARISREKVKTPKIYFGDDLLIDSY